MANIEKLRKQIIPGLVQLVDNEIISLAKLRRIRTGFYVSGMFLVMISLMESWEPHWPIWLITSVGASGGVVFGIGVHYDNSINQWPILKNFIDHDKLRQTAEEYKS